MPLRAGEAPLEAAETVKLGLADRDLSDERGQVSANSPPSAGGVPEARKSITIERFRNILRDVRIDTIERFHRLEMREFPIAFMEVNAEVLLVSVAGDPVPGDEQLRGIEGSLGEHHQVEVGGGSTLGLEFPNAALDEPRTR